MTMEFSPYAPATVNVLHTASTSLVEPDSALRTLVLTNKDAAHDVWLAVKPNAAVVGSGIRLMYDSMLSFDKDSIPLQGLNAIAETATVAVAVQKG